MASTVLATLLASGVSLLVSLALSYVTSSPNLNYRSSLVSSKAMWKISVIEITLRLWPVASIGGGVLLSRWFGSTMRWEFIGWTVAWSLLIVTIIEAGPWLQRKLKNRNDAMISETIRQELEPKIRARLGTVERSLVDTRIRVHVMRTPNGICGSVVLWVPHASQFQNTDVLRMVAKIVPPNLQLHVERR